jgi:RHS repeat-associated protein
MDDSTTPLLTVFYYDDYGRLIQQASQNHLKGKDYITNTYSFNDELLVSSHIHTPVVGNPIKIITTNTYDHLGRLLTTSKKIGEQTEVIQSQLVYNEIGQLKQKKLHADKTTPTNVIATVNYEYNERSWPTKISSEKFSEVLKYAEPEVTGKQYNGNIAEQHWGHDNSILSNTFKYTYDPLGKLKSGTSTQMSENIQYDIMGNIVRLARDTDPVMKYSYIGNRLTEIKRESDNVSLGTFIYNENGSATKDRLGMSVRYNHLNLPDSVYNTSTKIGYLYDAGGNKLRKYSTVGSSYIERDYIKGIEYLKINSSGTKSIDLVATEAGYLKSNGTNPYTYFYNLTDHLGNVRSTITKLTATTAQVVQKDDYYPFGKRKSAGLTNGINKYLYNSKEIQEEIGNQYDYKARFYDAEIGRWNVIDPVADEFTDHSPYHYAYNNPLGFTDPDGMRPADDGWYLPDGATSTSEAVHFEGTENRPGYTLIESLPTVDINVGFNSSWSWSSGWDNFKNFFDSPGLGWSFSRESSGAYGPYLPTDKDINSAGAVLSMIPATTPLGVVMQLSTAQSKAEFGMVVATSLPYVKIAKGVGRITFFQRHHLIPNQVYRAFKTDLKAINWKQNDMWNLKALPIPFHGNHPRYNKFVNKKISDLISNNSLNLQTMKDLQLEMRLLIGDAYKAEKKLNDFF